MNDHFKNHPTPAMYGFQSYISVPIIRRDGSFFGTLCAIDPKPGKLETPEIKGMFYLFADLISLHLDNLEKIQFAEARLKEEKKITAFGEEFIAILGHDLRNPVSAISSSLQLMNRMPFDNKLKKLSAIMQNSTYRISGLIDNMLDFARGRLGEGIILSKSMGRLENTLRNVISFYFSVDLDLFFILCQEATVNANKEKKMSRRLSLGLSNINRITKA